VAFTPVLRALGSAPLLRRRPCLACVCALACVGSSEASASPGLAVIPHPSSGHGLSYFKLSAAVGASVDAGTLELRNPTSRATRVSLSVVDGQTLSTLGSGYAPPGSPRHASASWVTLGAREVTVPSRSGLKVPVSVSVPAGSSPGDYLSGVSIQARDQAPQGLAKKGVAIASVERYAIGVEVVLAGPRTPAIRFTGAQLKREPAGLTFLLDARNTGNVILQGVHGHVRITRAGRTVLSQAIEPGTFITKTHIAYPLTTQQIATEGTRYRIEASLEYQGGRRATLDTYVTFGHRQATIQGRYTHATPATPGRIAWWMIAAGAAALLYGVFTTILLLRRGRRAQRQPART
jgi:hypothetical protein